MQTMGLCQEVLFTARTAEGPEVRTAPEVLYCHSFPNLGELTVAGVRIVSALFIPAAFERAPQHNVPKLCHKQSLQLVIESVSQSVSQ
jgi:hypothetical protein